MLKLSRVMAKSTNQKLEWPVASMFVNGSGPMGKMFKNVFSLKPVGQFKANMA
jgi:hypothetical protein